jgi:uncharacterized sulfatase
MEAKGDDDEQTDGKVASETIRLLEEHKSKPFFIAAGFYRPHVPDIATAKYFKLYPLQKVSLPDEPAQHIANIPPVALTTQPLNYGLDSEKLRLFKRAYFASISFVDAQIGKVLDAVDQLGLAENTIIILFGDHGWCLGEHGQWQKQLLFEESARVPFMIALPKTKVKGVCSKPVELVDIFPTLADLCGLKPPPNLEGFTLRPLLKNPKARWTHPAMTQQARNRGANQIMGYSVRSDRWRYTEWDEGKQGSELYDHDTDPHEWTNLATDSKQSGALAELKKMLAEAKSRSKERATNPR